MSTKIKSIGLRIDIETKSSTDIKHGVYAYTEDPDFEVLIVKYSTIRLYPGGATKLAPVRGLDFSDSSAVAAFRDLLIDPRFQKHAYNAQFERVALSRWMGGPTGHYIDPENWRCSMIRANVHGVFGSLDEVARAVRSPVAKNPDGKKLIRFFSIPIKAKKAQACGCVGFHDPERHPAEFKRYEAYCAQDVVTEAVVASQFPEIPEQQQLEYEADQRINDRGIRHWRALSQAAVAQVKVEQTRLMGELKTLTGLENPNSVQQFKGWLHEQDYAMVSTDKAHREDALADPMCPAHVKEALELKGAASLSSVQKHAAALASRSEDGRIRGTLRFYGAHTGRYAGRVIQPQNLPRYEALLADVRSLLDGTAGQDAPTIAKGCVRASLVPAPGHRLIVADYNAIEARTLGYAAGEKWVEDEFKTGDGKIYEATAAMMFNVQKADLLARLKQCGKCGKPGCAACQTRSQAKVANLALGYAGGAGALVTMGAAEAGMDVGNYVELNAEWVAAGSPGKFHEWERDRHEYPYLLHIRDLYREASQATVRFWKLCERAWDRAALQGKATSFGQNECITMVRDGKHNRIILPSGRSIWYRFARSHYNPKTDKVEARTFIGKGVHVGHTRLDTFGGRLTENINQAFARDVLQDLLMKFEAKSAQGWPAHVVLHVHDEAVLETDERYAKGILKDALDLMSIPPDWAPGLAVKGAGAIMKRYGK